ncbi:MAG: cytochrome c biogenesis protein CcdA [Chloroflexota bacterium]
MESSSLSLATALVAGLLSFFSPCVLPLVPVYLGYMTGQLAAVGGSPSRWRVMLHALAFVAGFGLVFVALGATAGLLGRLIQPILPYIVRAGGALLIVLGLHLMGVITIPFLHMDRRLDVRPGAPGLWSSFLVGLVFAAGWTPCVGPVLTAILILAASSQTVALGASLLGVYALGLGLPFLIIAALMDAAGPVLRRMRRLVRAAALVGGALLIVMGLALLSGWFTTLVFWINARLTPGA